MTLSWILLYSVECAYVYALSQGDVYMGNERRQKNRVVRVVYLWVYVEGGVETYIGQKAQRVKIK